MQKIMLGCSIAGLLLLCWLNGMSKLKKEDYSQFIASQIEFAEEQVQLEAYGSAIDSYKEVLEIEQTPSHYKRLAEIYQLAGQTENEISLLKQCIILYPEEKTAWERILQYYASVGERENSMFYLEKYADIYGWEEERLQQYLEYKYLSTVRTEGFSEAGDFFGGNALVQDAVSEKWYYLDDRLKRTYGPECDEASARLGDIAGVTIDGHANFIDASGAKYLDSAVDYEKTWSFTEQKALIKDASGYGYVNSRFEPIFSHYTEAGIFVNGVAAVKTEEGWYLLNADGQQIGENVYYDIKMDENRICSFNNRIFVKSDEGYIIVDTEGNRKGELSFEDAKPFHRGGYAAVKKNGKWGYVDTEGNWKIEPGYEDAESFGEELGAVSVNGKWGFITDSGRMVIEPQFDAAKHVVNGKAPVKKGDLWFYLCMG